MKGLFVRSMLSRLALVMAVVMCCMALTAMAGCSGSGSSLSGAHSVYQMRSFLSESNREYNCYEIVYYRMSTKQDANKIIEHEDDALVGYIDEIHCKKAAGYTEKSVADLVSEAYPSISTMDFVSTSISDEGDYYCALVKFDNLDDKANIQKLVDAGILTKSKNDDGDNSVDGLINAGFYMMNLRTNGWEKLSDDEVSNLDLHFEA